MISGKLIYRTKISTNLFITLYKRYDNYFFEITTLKFRPIATISATDEKSIKDLFKEITGRELTVKLNFKNEE